MIHIVKLIWNRLTLQTSSQLKLYCSQLIEHTLHQQSMKCRMNDLHPEKNKLHFVAATQPLCSGCACVALPAAAQIVVLNANSIEPNVSLQQKHICRHLRNKTQTRHILIRTRMHHFISKCGKILYLLEQLAILLQKWTSSSEISLTASCSAVFTSSSFYASPSFQPWKWSLIDFLRVVVCTTTLLCAESQQLFAPSQLVTYVWSKSWGTGAL